MKIVHCKIKRMIFPTFNENFPSKMLNMFQLGNIILPVQVLIGALNIWKLTLPILQVNRKLCVISGHFSTFSRSDALTARVKNHPQLYWESEISINTKKGFSKMIFVVMLKYFRHRHYKKLAGSMGSCCSTNHYIPNVSLAWYWNLKYC